MTLAEPVHPLRDRQRAQPCELVADLARAADRIGEGSNDFAMTQRYLDLMEDEKISWTDWNFSDDHRSGAVFDTGTCNDNGPWTGTSSLKEAGVWIRDHIRSPDDFPTG